MARLEPAFSDVLIRYFKERFPLPGVILVSSIFALFILSIHISPGRNFATEYLILVILFVGLLLRQRVTDEFKDEQHDKKNFPSRPLQRGIISKQTLLMLGMTGLLVELSAVLLLVGIYGFLLYAIVILFTLLMAKEFYLGSWLERHFTTYFLIHEAFFVLLGLWVIFSMKLSINFTTVAWLVSFLAAMMSIEIVRKFEIRKDPRGKIVRDTYTAVWGENTTRSYLELLTLISGIALSYAESSYIPAIIAAAAALVLNFLRPESSRLQIILGIYLMIITASGVFL